MGSACERRFSAKHEEGLSSLQGGGSAAPAKQEAEDKNLFCGIYSQGHLSPQCMDDGFFLHQTERRKEGEGVGCHG